MIILDTDHINVLQYQGQEAAVLAANMTAAADQEFATTAVTIEEQMRGWLALIHRHREVHKQISAYERLVGLFDFFARWHILPFDNPAADTFVGLRKQKVRIATMDLKIASIARANNSLLLSANLNDFGRVPGLKVENWLQ